MISKESLEKFKKIWRGSPQSNRLGKSDKIVEFSESCLSANDSRGI